MTFGEGMTKSILSQRVTYLVEIAAPIDNNIGAALSKLGEDKDVVVNIKQIGLAPTEATPMHAYAAEMRTGEQIAIGKDRT